MAGILAGNYGVDDESPAFRQAAPGTPAMQQLPSDGPWIGSDGGMIGRGIKAAGDWYQGYINEHRDGLMDEMKDKLTPPDMAIDALEAGSRAYLSAKSGVEMPYEPRYAINKAFGLMAYGPKMMTRGMAMLPALVQGARFWGGQTLKPEEMGATAKSLGQTGVLGLKGVGTAVGQQKAETIGRGFDGLNEGKKLLFPEQ